MDVKEFLKSYREFEQSIDIEKDLAKCREMRQKVEDVISQLSNKKWQIIMRYRYINGLTFDEIALSLGNDIRHIYRVHGWALEELRKKITFL